MRLLRVLLVAFAVIGAVSTPASAVTRASLADIEHEVMCPVCGTLLELSDSPQAQRERAFINTLIAKGMTKRQIEDALVQQYGPNVLATPSDHGFDLAAWIVPALVVIALAGGLGWVWWRRVRPGPGPGREEPRPLAPEDSARLDADISSYDL